MNHNFQHGLWLSLKAGKQNKFLKINVSLKCLKNTHKVKWAELFYLGFSSRLYF